MKRGILITVFILVLHSFSLGAQAEETSEKVNAIFYEHSGVVKILVEKRGGGTGRGSGIIINVNGMIAVLTNNHVVESSLRIWISFLDRGSPMQEVFLIGRDPIADAALLTAPLLPEGVVPERLGNSNTLDVGDPVYALGIPFGVKSASSGFVNALESPLPPPFSWLFFQSNAPVHVGSSGGPMYNEEEEVIGMNTAILDRITFTTHINYIKRLFPLLRRKKVVEHASAGILVEDVWDIAPSFFENLGYDYPPPSFPSGAVVVYDVQQGSPAENAGIQEGDIVLELNNAPIQNARDFMEKLFFDYSPNDRVILTVQRGAQQFQHTVTLERLEKLPFQASPEK